MTDTLRGPPMDADDARLSAFFRVTVGPILTNGRASHDAVRDVQKIMAYQSLGMLEAHAVNGQPHICLMLSLRGGRVANAAWGHDGCPPGSQRLMVPDPEMPIAEVIVAPLRGTLDPSLEDQS